MRSRERKIPSDAAQNGKAFCVTIYRTGKSADNDRETQ